jgi:hypothetical protein
MHGAEVFSVGCFASEKYSVIDTLCEIVPHRGSGAQCVERIGAEREWIRCPTRNLIANGIWNAVAIKFESVRFFV